MYRAVQQDGVGTLCLTASLNKHDYFTVYFFDLTMPNSTSKAVQMAERDFPGGLSEKAILQWVITRMGAELEGVVTYNEEITTQIQRLSQHFRHTSKAAKRQYISAIAE